MTDPTNMAAIAVSAGLASVVLTHLVRAFARRRHLLDHPNERSAHSTPTPRLGGIGLMVPFLLAGTLMALADAGSSSGPALTVLGATAAIAALGLVDDVRPLAARWRFAVQAVLATAVVLSRGRSIGDALTPLDGIVAYPVLLVGSILWIVWATNLYNFMDGIDGLAGGQAVFASIGLAWAAAASGDSLLSGLLLVLAATATGFLRYNLPRASIFMGDVGSTAIGFFLASVPFATASRPIPVLAVAMALSLFVLDSTTTLVRRVAKGEEWHAPHRTHLYQQLLAFGVPHGRITYSAYVGMAVVAGMAAFYPVASDTTRAWMFLLALILFLGAWSAVRMVKRSRASASKEQ